jgi:hypothetical protein
MKLIKLSDNHYIIVNDSEINENQWYCIDYVLFLSDTKFDTGNNPNQNKRNKLVTHSTLPLELIEGCNFGYKLIKPLSISEVEKLTNNDKLFTIEDMEYCYNTASRRGQMQEVGLEPDLGFNDYMRKYHNQPTNNNQFTIKDMIEFGNWLSKEYNVSNGIGWWYSHKSNEDVSTEELIKMWKEQQQSKTEWNVAFNEFGELILKFKTND